MVNPLAYSDFRSDTATAPTPEMFEAMMKSSLGDDVYYEDDSVKALEKYVATLCGHQAALYCSSGTMTNQLAHRVHLCNPPQSAMVDIRSHVFNYEAGGISFHSQAAVVPIMPANGHHLTVEDLEPRLVQDVDVHYAPTRVVSLENTLNGTIMPLEEIVRIRAFTNEHNVKLHLDGARLWHASIATGISMKEYCSHFDSISLCLSKGIGAPIGSILVGSEQVIKKARHFRLLFGGGWRQAGFLAEAALWCIKTNWPSMERTHRQAKWLEQALEHVGCIITNPVDTNMIWIDTSDTGFIVEELMEELSHEGIKITGSGTAARLVLHYQISDQVIETFIGVLRKMASTPRMKVLIDMTVVAMREDAMRFRDSVTNSLSRGPQREQKPRKKLEVSTALPEPEAQEPSPKSKVPFSPRKTTFDKGELSEPEEKPEWNVRSLFRRSSPSRLIKQRPKSWYEPAEFIKTDDPHQRGEQEADVPKFADVRRTKSLDLLHEARSFSVSSKDQSSEDDVKKIKKASTFQRLAHNPASKAFRRASIRVQRWSTMLTKDKEE
ncbi:Threonine aldolase [Mortierella antarctica]|nr:Threonine aldolase [Mortierella antarctica]